MSWYRKYAQASASISVDVSQYAEAMRVQHYKILEFQQSEASRLANFSLNTSRLLQTMRDVGVSEAHISFVQRAINHKDAKALTEAWWTLYNEYVRKMTYRDPNYERARWVVKTIQDYESQLDRSSPTYTPLDERQIEQSLVELVTKTTKNMESIVSVIQNAISRIPNWHGSTVRVVASGPSGDDQVDWEEGGDSATIEFGADDFAPSFSFFNIDNNIVIDDVLEAGDKDFFTDPSTQSDYFNLIAEIRKPGSRSQAGRMLTLYTARPIKDRQRYLDAKSIPSNLFLTSRFDSAEGLAFDLGGSEGMRDVWKVRINEKYLVQTLDIPGEKQYQVVGDGEVPVGSMELISAGRAN